MSGLTSHVLDTLNGIPACRVAVSLYKITAQEQQLLSTTTTDSNGHCTLADKLACGRYRIEFSIGDYFAQTKLKQIDVPRYQDKVSVEFGVADIERHYHIPLVASPWSYTTYRGGAPAISKQATSNRA